MFQKYVVSLVACKCYENITVAECSNVLPTTLKPSPPDRLCSFRFPVFPPFKPFFQSRPEKEEVVRFQSPSPLLSSSPLFTPPLMVKGNRQLLQDDAQFLPEPKLYAEAHHKALSLSREMNAYSCTEMHKKASPGF